jgi:hypothetical protein
MSSVTSCVGDGAVFICLLACMRLPVSIHLIQCMRLCLKRWPVLGVLSLTEVAAYFQGSCWPATAEVCEFCRDWCWLASCGCFVPRGGAPALR